MKKFCIISLLLLLPAMAKPCFVIGYDNTYWSYFTMNEFGEDYEPDFKQFWSTYIGKPINSSDLSILTSTDAVDASKSQNPIYVAARQKNDSEMLEYLKLNNIYRQRRNNDYDFCSELYKEAYANNDEYISDWDEWYYPTKEDLAKEKSNLEEVIAKTKAYKGTKYADRYILLTLRALFQTGQFDALCSYYTQNIDRVPATSDCRYSIDDLYAGALLRTGKKDEAMELYAKISDNLSLSWCIAGKSEYKTLMQTYDKNHNSRIIPWIMVQYINSMEYELKRNNFYNDKDSLNHLAVISEVKSFVAQANSIADSKATDAPALWKSAAAYCDYYLGNHAAAKKEIDAAMTMDGNASVKENTRMSRLLIYAADPNYTPQNAKLLLQELKWLKSLTQGDIKRYIENLETVANATADKMTEVGVQALHNSICITDTTGYAQGYGLGWFYSIDDDGQLDYSSKFFAALLTLTAKETDDFYNKYASRDELSKWLSSHVEHNTNYINDIIGTKYLAEGNFAKASEFLAKVPLKFLDSQTIAKYMYYRKYTQGRWEGRQTLGNHINTWETNTEAVPALKNNPKLEFSKEMQALLAQPNNPETAYEIATRYFQASHDGDCWYLAHYFNSRYINEKTTPNEIDFTAKAVEYLEKAAATSDPSLKETALYALAYVGAQTEPMIEEHYNEETYRYEYTTNTNSLQYKALKRLAEHEEGRTASPIISNCGVYTMFVHKNKK